MCGTLVVNNLSKLSLKKSLGAKTNNIFVIRRVYKMLYLRTDIRFLWYLTAFELIASTHFQSRVIESEANIIYNRSYINIPT